MDKFAKTTEIDISNMTFEEEPPQKHKAGKIIAIILSLLISVAIWLYVIETDETKIEKEFKDVSVNIINSNDTFNITPENANVVLIGTTSQLVDIEKSDIIIEIDASQIKEVGRYDVIAKSVYVENDIMIEVENQASFYVTVDVREK